MLRAVDMAGICRVFLPGQNTIANTLREPGIRFLSARFMALSQAVLPALGVITLATGTQGLTMRKPTVCLVFDCRGIVSSPTVLSSWRAMFQMALKKVRRTSLVPRYFRRLRDIQLFLSVE